MGRTHVTSVINDDEFCINKNEYNDLHKNENIYVLTANGLVSRSADGIVKPILYIASITSSAGIRDSIPASAISAAVRAFVAPAALRLTHGTSTRPATGSQTRPSMFFIAIAKAWALISGVEAFDDDAAEAHVKSDHFQAATATGGPMHSALTATPKIISRQIDGDGWDAMGELQID